MGVRQQDCVSLQLRHAPKPIGAAVDHQLRVTLADEQRAVPTMPAGFLFDFAASAQKK